MKRLTIPDVRVDEHTTRRSMIDVAAVREHAMEFYWRLKAYEDTGIEPEAVETVKLALCAKHMVDLETLNNTPISRLVELAEADKDGRVIILPCKVDDVVYGFHNNRQTILPMVAKWIETNADGWTVAAQYTPMAPMFYQFSDFGKTVFLTREEAEKALQKMEGRS